MNFEAPTPTRCTAKNRAGEPCKKWAIRGHHVCATHGGSAPGVKRVAERRLAAYKLGLAFARNPDAILAELGCIASARVSKMFDDDGNLLPIKDMPEEVQAAIASFVTATGNVDTGDGKRDRVAKVNLADKIKALDVLTKHHGLQTEKVEHKGDIVFRWES